MLHIFCTRWGERFYVLRLLQFALCSHMLPRLRARYRGRVGKLKVRDVIPQEVMLAKARGARGMACRAGRAGALRAEF